MAGNFTVIPSGATPDGVTLIKNSNDELEVNDKGINEAKLADASVSNNKLQYGLNNKVLIDSLKISSGSQSSVTFNNLNSLGYDYYILEGFIIPGSFSSIYVYLNINNSGNCDQRIWKSNSTTASINNDSNFRLCEFLESSSYSFRTTINSKSYADNSFLTGSLIGVNSILQGIYAETQEANGAVISSSDVDTIELSSNRSFTAGSIITLYGIKS